MRFAMIENTRTEPAHGLKGHCPGCGQTMIARCGTQRIWHWAHKGKRVCDPWWETETPWHRAWKSHFPLDWQEVIGHDASGEKHIADIRTAHGLVIEFQHSHLRPEERKAREAFHGNLVWVVDGTRLKRDLPRFEKEKRSLMTTPIRGVLSHHFPEEVFPKDWIECSVPVLFDFGQAPEGAERDDALWCLMPGRADGRAILVCFQKGAFIKHVLEHSTFLQGNQIVDALTEYYQQARKAAAREAARMFPPPARYRRAGYRGRGIGRRL